MKKYSFIVILICLLSLINCSKSKNNPLGSNAPDSLAAPENLQCSFLSHNSYEDAVTYRLTWGSVENATSYKVYYKAFSTGNSTSEFFTVDDTSFDLALYDLDEWELKVWSIWSDEDNTVLSNPTALTALPYKFEVPKNIASEIIENLPNGDKAFKISWDEIKYAGEYKIEYVFADQDSVYKENINENFYDIILLSGAELFYKIQAVGNDSVKLDSDFSIEKYISNL